MEQSQLLGRLRVGVDQWCWEEVWGMRHLSEDNKTLKVRKTREGKKHAYWILKERGRVVTEEKEKGPDAGGLHASP